MTTHNFYKAQSLRNEPIESRTLIFDEPIPESKTLKHHAKLCDEQATQICNVILNTLAQGVTDRIIAILMAKRATLFVFPQEDKK